MAVTELAVQLTVSLAESGGAGWADWKLAPAVVTAVCAALVAVIVYVGNAKSARDKEAHEVHRIVTTGAGAAARAALSAAEYNWWNDGEHPFESVDPEFKCSARLIKQFYVADASLDQLVTVLKSYRRGLARVSWGRQARHRRLLGWHAGIHIAWIAWFIALASKPKGDFELDVPKQLAGEQERVREALDLIGRHRTGRHVESPEIEYNITVGEFAQSELNRWKAAGDTKYGAGADQMTRLNIQISMLFNTTARSRWDKVTDVLGITIWPPSR